MNLRLFSLALLVSALPVSLAAASALSFNKGDFIAAEKVSRNGETVLDVKLSKSGKAKLRKLNRDSVGKKVHIEVGGIPADLRLREPIEGDRMEFGPYSPADAAKIVSEINHQK